MKTSCMRLYRAPGSVWVRVVMLICAVGMSFSSLAQGNQRDLPVFGEGDSYYQVDSLNRNLPAVKEPVNLQTPQSSLENFILSSKEGDYLRAAQSLNFNLIPRVDRREKAAELAEKLFYVINQTFWIDWRDIPDRPDGQTDDRLGKQDGSSTRARRVIPIGTVELDGRDIEINLARVRAGKQSPVWMISAQTVENIDALYATHGPGLLDRHLPDWLKLNWGGRVAVYQWVGLVALFALSWLCGWLVQRLITRMTFKSESQILRGLVASVPGPISVLLALIIFYILYAALLSLPGPVTAVMNPTISILIISAFTWLAMGGIGYISDYVHKFYIDSIREDDDERARKLLTNISVAKRVLIFIAFFGGAGIAMSQLDVFQTLGASMLASAGVATVILGVAAHNTLGNIFAGIQIAISQPVRIGDNVYFDGNWGDIEEITYTYLTLNTWDSRRLIIPLTDFLSRPIENWTKNKESMIKPVHIYADYSIDVQKVRDAFIEMARDCEEWDESEEPSLEVVDCSEQTIKLRGIVPAKNPYAAWDMYCRLTEQMVAFIRNTEDGKYLPRRRMETWQHQA